jgi:hypothetical protein
VTNPALAAHAHRLADLAREFLDESKVVNDKTAQQPVGESHPRPEVNDLLASMGPARAGSVQGT